MLLAALSRAIATMTGDATVRVDLAGPGRSVLKPDVDLRRTVGWFNTLYPVALNVCDGQDMSARQLSEEVHDTLAPFRTTESDTGCCVTSTRHRAAARRRGSRRCLLLLCRRPPRPAGVVVDDAPVQLDVDTAMPVREAIPGLGHPIELRVYRSAGVIHFDWWYDTRKIKSATVQGFADAFTQVVMDLTREAIIQDETDAGSDELTLVDLSSNDTA